MVDVVQRGLGEVHVMVDLETLDNSPTSIITQIGLAAFRLHGENSQGSSQEIERYGPQLPGGRRVGHAGEIAPLRLDVSAYDGQKSGGTMSVDTVLWWLRQDKEAQVRLFRPYDDKTVVSLANALTQITQWFSRLPYGGREPEMLMKTTRAEMQRNFILGGVWGHGSSFDCVILRETYRRCGVEAPWKFSLDQDTRTILKDRGLSGKESSLRDGLTQVLSDARSSAGQVSSEFVQHDALDDVVRQIVMIQRARTLPPV